LLQRIKVIFILKACLSILAETYIAVDSSWKMLDDPKKIKEQYLLHNVAAIQRN